MCYRLVRSGGAAAPPSRFRTIQVCPKDLPPCSGAGYGCGRPTAEGMPAMRRREFILALGGAAAWPFAAGAQQRERVRRIGVLNSLAADDPEGQARLKAFQ